MGRYHDRGHPRMTRIYRYILTHDGGMAPCPEGGLITLGTCKPVIRRCARPGDWVVGFRPGSLSRGLLLWAGKVDRKLTHGEYQRTHPRRTDAVYRLGADGQYERLAPEYHPNQDEMDRDTREPVLLFDPQHSHYFHGVPQPLPDDLFHLAAAGRGHRVTEAAPAEVARLEAWLSGLGPVLPGREVYSGRTCGTSSRRKRRC